MQSNENINDAYIEKLKEKVRLKRGLPHLFGHKLYPWQRKFLESTNKKNFLTAANQIGKSLINIKKCITWATDKTLWKKLWPHYELISQFWYFYPDYKLATTEMYEKWQLEVLPRKEHLTEDEWKIYGWEPDFDRKEIRAIYFNSGITVYFKAYSQKASALQAGSVFALFCDEELPVELYDELKFRLSATDGFFHMCFTATLGQELWRQVMEEKGDFELFKDAFKQQVSLFDCMVYEDGTKSPWTIERIQKRIRDCSSQKEIDKRIYGKFVKAEGLKYPSFDYSKHMSDKISPDTEKWEVFVGLDYGSGGAEGHPSAIVFLRTNPEYTEGEVFLTWRGDDIQTTAGDLLNKYFELVAEHKIENKITAVWYDYHCRDLKTLSERVDQNFLPANKKHDQGEQVLNTLFKCDSLKILRSPESEKLAHELQTVQKGADKRHSKDDLSDALRYGATSIPWNLDVIRAKIAKEEKPKENLSDLDLKRREAAKFDEKLNLEQDIQDEISFWNELVD